MWLHKFKCMKCGLHFVVCSWYENWPHEGTTQKELTGETSGLVFCPECGSTSSKLYYRESREAQIYQEVPGMAELHGFIGN